MLSLNLVGAGSKGIITCGALKRIHELGIKPDIICGTSSGALNAMLFAQGDMEFLEQLWLGIRDCDVHTGVHLWDMFGGCPHFYDNTPLLRTIQKYFWPEKIQTPYWVTATDIAQSIPVRTRIDSHSRNAWHDILASTAIPILFPPVGGKYDGGVTDNYNIRFAIEQGATEVIIIHPSVPQSVKMRNVIDVIAWTIHAGEWANYINEMSDLSRPGCYPHAFKITPIVNATPLDLSVLDFSYKGYDRKDLIQIGYDMTKKVLG